MSFPVSFLVLPAFVGTAAFAITVRAIGGKIPMPTSASSAAEAIRPGDLGDSSHASRLARE